jgi:hypothetical protein
MPDTNPDNVVSLITAIDSQLENVHTQALDLSFNELLDMRRNGELNINPDYQRLFQWTDGAQSRLVESLLLEMPVPPIYVVEEADGKYTLIDGLQRISSYLHLRGELAAPHRDPPIALGDKLRLVDCDIVADLNGKTFDDLGTALQIRLKRAFVRVEVVRKGSDSKFKYHMFKRLNMGGQTLSNQQLRNCTIRLLDPKFNDFIIELSREGVFRNTAAESITEDQRMSAFDQELVLRFFAFKNYRNSYVHDIADYLTEYMERVSDPDSAVNLPFDYDRERERFVKTFTLFDRTLGDRAFCFANKKRDNITGGFGVYHFEAFALGVQASLDQIDVEDRQLMLRLAELFRSIKFNEEFYRITTGGGKNSRGPLQARIEFVEKAVSEAL